MNTTISDTHSPQPQKTHPYLSKRMLIVLLLGFVSGIPLALTGSTLQMWMTDAKIDVSTIGIFSLVGIPYAWKVWAPLLDRYMPPFLGRRRGWLIFSQILLALSIAVMAFSNPVESITFFACIAVVVAFFSSTQDIVIDAYRIEIVDKDQQAAGASLYVMGYRLAMLTSGAFLLYLTSTSLEGGLGMSWRSAYLLMAGVMGVGVIATLMGPEPELKNQPKTLKEAVVVPFLDFFKRPGAIEIIIFVILYKLDVVFAQNLLSKFLRDMQFTKIEIASAFKVFGLIATICGGLIGGYLVPKLGMFLSLLFFGIFQGLTTLLLVAVAHVGPHLWILYTAIAGENLASGMATAAYSAFLALLCNRKFTATQYALLTSLMALTRTIGVAPSGTLAKQLGVDSMQVIRGVSSLEVIEKWTAITQAAWTQYFMIATFLAIPALLMLFRYKKWTLAPVEAE